MTTPEMKERFGKVAVLMGGNSAEREVSLNSGAAVLAALIQSGVDAHGIDAREDVIGQLRSGNYERVFIVLHGRGGEDGSMQGALQILGLPYTGSGIMGCAVSMDKLKTKQIWQGMGLPTPAFATVNNEKELLQAVNDLGLPLILKPSLEGSSIGISKISSIDDIQEAWDEASQYGCEVLAEAWVDGAEYTVSILNNTALPLIRLETPHEIYDYDAKYRSDTTGYFIPSGLDDDKEKEFQALALKAFKAVGAEGWGRVDLMCDKAGKPYLIEVNTVPGMTDHSLVPMAAKARGIDFQKLVMSILEHTLSD